MKSSRQQKILELVNVRHIETQEELLTLLRECGFSVTQATVSRDIRELRLTKTLDVDGKYYYKITRESGHAGFGENLFLLFANSVVQVRSAQNMVVIKCLTGTAGAVCAAFDAISWTGILGTLAGDDTIFVVMESEAEAKNITERLREMLS